MREQHGLVRHRHHVVVEGARLDRGGVLFDEDAARGVEAVLARDGAAGLFVLARGKAPARAAIDEYFYARRPWPSQNRM